MKVYGFKPGCWDGFKMSKGRARREGKLQCQEEEYEELIHISYVPMGMIVNEYKGTPVPSD